ncbi:hypothetical protein BBP40_001202 [Aspergillus hancockii]|nr:hypothetical protein BBP40_001202 [Aspergillus hancockii]
MPYNLRPKIGSNTPFRQGGVSTSECSLEQRAVEPAGVTPSKGGHRGIASADETDSGHDVREISFLSTPDTELSKVSGIFSDCERRTLTSDTEDEASDDTDVAGDAPSPTPSRKKISTHRAQSSDVTHRASAETVHSKSSIEPSDSAQDQNKSSTEEGLGEASSASYRNDQNESTALKKKNHSVTSSQELDTEMMSCLKERPNMRKNGQVYVVQLIDWSDYVRVWKTPNFEQHKKQGKSWGRCLSKQSGEYKVNSQLVGGYEFWMALMHCELSPVSYQFKCSPCGTTTEGHKGIFKAEFGRVLEIHERWFNWLKLEPYDESGKLKLRWYHRLHQLLDSYDLVKSPAPVWDFERSKKRWDEFAQRPLETDFEDSVECATCQKYQPSGKSLVEPTSSPQPLVELTDTKTENGRRSTSRRSTGGVSITGILLAKAAGAITIVTSSSNKKLSFVKSKLQPNYSINYKKNPD